LPRGIISFRNYFFFLAAGFFFAAGFLVAFFAGALAFAIVGLLLFSCN
jgi:hypothetical protein